MKINKTKNATRNIFFGVVLKLYQIIVPFFFRTVMIRTIGVQYLGLSSLFSSVLQVLNLAELGVGSAMVFSMYKPIAEDDFRQINALMRMYKIYYRIIGGVILIIGVICLPLIPKLIHGNIPEDMNIYVLYLMNLGATVLTYWLFAYRGSILQAYQRQDIISKISLVTVTIKYALQLFVLYCYKNYYLYVIVNIITQILLNISTAYLANRFYPQHTAEGELSKEAIKSINGKIKDLFTSKLGGTIVHSADTIVISSFLGLELLAIYQNYYYIISSVMAFITIINKAVVSGVGNSLLVNTEEENYKEFKTFSFMQFWILGICVCCFCALFQPFMKIWMGEDMLLPYPIIVCLCLAFIGERFIQMMSTYKDAAGIWHEDRFRPLIAGLCNLAVNLILVQFWGLYGIVISTILSEYLISIPWITRNIFQFIFPKEKITTYIFETICWMLTIIINTSCCYYLCVLISDSGILTICLKLIICIIITNISFALAFNRKDELKKLISIAKRSLNIKS